MDADFLGAALALRNITERRRRGRARARLDCGPRFVFRRPQQGGGEATARILHAVDGVFFAVRWGGRRYFHALGKCLRACSKIVTWRAGERVCCAKPF
jgi:hypothetical protein